MNLKLLLFMSALVACISLSTACLDCLQSSCKNGEICMNAPKMIVRPGLLPKYLQLLRLQRLSLLKALTCPNCKGSLDFLNPLCPKHYKIDVITSDESSEESSEESSTKCSKEITDVVQVLKKDCSDEDDVIRIRPHRYHHAHDICHKCGHRKFCNCDDHSKHSVCRCHHHH